MSWFPANYRHASGARCTWTIEADDREEAEAFARFMESDEWRLESLGEETEGPK